eukprot:6175593-Pleurochrysis_carterae.AAC.3
MSKVWWCQTRSLWPAGGVCCRLGARTPHAAPKRPTSDTAYMVAMTGMPCRTCESKVPGEVGRGGTKVGTGSQAGDEARGGGDGGVLGRRARVGMEEGGRGSSMGKSGVKDRWGLRRLRGGDEGRIRRRRTGGSREEAGIGVHRAAQNHLNGREEGGKEQRQREERESKERG